jgi:hypothetical protein
LYAGWSKAELSTVPTPVAWASRPVSSAARVGEQIAVVWKRL